MVKKIFFLMLLFLASNLYAKPISLLLDWYINPNHAPILVAMSHGYFEKKGLEIKLVEPSDATDQAKLIALKKADIAITYQPHFLQEKKHHLPIQQIGTLIPIPLDCIIYLPQSGIHSAQDLKNKRVGYSDASNEFYLLKSVLKSANLSLNDVILINVHYNLIQALMMGKIDLAVGMMRNVEPIILQQHGFSPDMFYPENFGIAPYSELIFIAPMGEITPAMKKFLKALEESTAYLQQHPQEAWQEAIKKFPSLNTKTNHNIWQKTAPLFASHPQVIS